MREFASNKYILVIGGAGFIGSNLCERLLIEGTHKVVVLDNYFTGSISNHIKGVQYIKGNSSEIANLIKFSPEFIYHLGEYSRVEQSFEDKKLIWEYNSKSIFDVLDFAISNDSKLIYAGSSTKFTKEISGKGLSPYSWSKATNTELIINYGNWYNLNYAIVYFYNVYGPNEISTGKYATLIGIYKQAVLEKKPLKVVLPGNQLRNFTHVSDIVDGLLLVGKNGAGDNYGIGSQDSYSILQIAHLFKSEIVFLAERKGNRMGSELVTSKTKALGWNAKMSLENYINQFLNEL